MALASHGGSKVSKLPAAAPTKDVGATSGSGDVPPSEDLQLSPVRLTARPAGRATSSAGFAALPVERAPNLRRARHPTDLIGA